MAQARKLLKLDSPARQPLQLRTQQNIPEDFGLCRIEFTLFSQDAKGIFNFNHSDTRISDTLTVFTHHGLKNGIHPECCDRSLDNVIRIIAKDFKEPED